MTTANKLTRDAPGLFIEETLFTCLARFCQHFKGYPERLSELFKPVVSQLDNGEPARLPELCADETTRAYFGHTYSGCITNSITAHPEALLAALWTQPASNGLFREYFLTWLSDKAKEVHEWQEENPDPMATRFEELIRFTFKLEFDYLTEEGKRTFFHRMFAPLNAGNLTPDAERRLRSIPDLTPGDFRTVRQEFDYHDDSVSPALLIDALERESAAKRGLRSRNRINGFAGSTVC